MHSVRDIAKSGRRPLLVMSLAPLAGLLLTVAARAEAEEIDFVRDIRPILSDNCFHCHGPDASTREADLRLDLEQGVFADRDGHAVVVRGEPEQSELVRRIAATDEGLRMPPAETGKELKPDEIEMFRRWIAEGAAWSLPWAYVAPQPREVPDVEREDWPRNWIDRFVLARLEAAGIAPSPPADAVTLFRRLTFDLTGLPPTIDQLEAFVEDDSPQAYERAVDRLLASPHFGERMAMYWLDLVRYADTVGYHGDQDHNISPYRDWVIEAFNRNMPFDEFTVAQLAGDLVAAQTDGLSDDEVLALKIASGYNRLLQTSHEGGVQPTEYLTIYQADRVRNVSAVWMAATMGCAQCHDHKYDPYTTRDFYSMAAFFADIDEARHFTEGGNSLPTNRPPEIEVLSDVERSELAGLEQRRAELAEQLAALGEGDEQAVEKLQAAIEKVDARRQEIHDNARKSMITAQIEPREIRILPRGNWLDDSGDVVQPAVPEFLGRLESADGRASRRDLAEWLTDAEQGVGAETARVMVNRFWYLLFGEGLARQLDDFGGQGVAPSHPELLDRLALEFVASGWDVKRMIKELVMSQTYRQSSTAPAELRERDPDNRLLARQASFRLPAEMIRDNALAVSGLLIDEVGGASVKPYQPEGYYRHLNFPERTYQHHDDRRQWRRGVYVHWQRQFLHPMLKAFDAPSREECTAQRPRSNTPLAALTLLNDPTFVEAARVFAARIVESDASGDDERIRLAYRMVASRPPAERDVESLVSLLNESRTYYQSHVEDAARLVSIGQAPVAEADQVELAAWTMVARGLLNTSEAVMRN